MITIVTRQVLFVRMVVVRLIVPTGLWFTSYPYTLSSVILIYRHLFLHPRRNSLCSLWAALIVKLSSVILFPETRDRIEVALPIANLPLHLRHPIEGIEQAATASTAAAHNSVARSGKGHDRTLNSPTKGVTSSRHHQLTHSVEPNVPIIQTEAVPAARLPCPDCCPP